jgi:hypothetical protein
MQVLVKGIRSEVYLKEGNIHVFQAPFVVQQHREKKNPKDKLLLANPRNFSSSNL